MELVDVRTRVLEQADWQPNPSTAFVAKMNRFINRAYQHIYEDVPFLLEAVLRIVTLADYFSVTNSVDRLATTADEYVMKRTGAVAAGIAAWAVDGSWDGRWVDITDTAGVVRRVQTREWWVSLADSSEYFSMVLPWKFGAMTGMTYRIYSPDYPLPGDVVEIKSAQLYHGANNNLQVAAKGDIEQARLIDYQGRDQGMPRLLYMGMPFQMLSPTRAPTVALRDPLVPGSLWIGPDNAGQFDICYTYVWGNRDIKALVAPLGQYEPIWESAPSPVSDKLTATNGGLSMIISNIPDIEFELNFNISGTLRAGHSGIRKRIYIRRYTSDQSGALTRAIESPAVFMLFAEIDGSTTSIEYYGQAVLDYQRRLKPIHNHNSIRIYPCPDARYEIDVRAQVRPLELTNDYDAPRIPEDAMDLLISKALVHLFEYDQKPERAQIEEMRYQDMLRTVTKRYGTISYDKTTKHLARVAKGPIAQRARSVTWTGIT